MATFGQSVTTLYNSRNVSPAVHGHDTVGAVALDAEGNLAAATSTGVGAARLEALAKPPSL